MCGISGIHQPAGIDPVLLQILPGILKHRGPDANGTFSNGRTAFFHNRLSILDLSESGNQPMFSSNGRYITVYNGEVYNFMEIANDIKSHNHSATFKFKSSSDTEIILEAFSIWGPDFVHKLNGMFSIVIMDQETGTIYLFRDRLGIKPLFYCHDKENFYFSSELKTFKAIPGLRLDTNHTAVSLYLQLGFIPAPHTIYQQVQKVMPGEYLVFKDNQVTSHKYWSAHDVITAGTITSEKMALVKLSELLKSSVQYQLISDVPVGVFLSGGIDSSLITALAVNLSAVKVNTFSIGFEENRYDESAHARRIAEFLGTSHNEFILSYKYAIGLIDKYTDVYEEPFADSSGIPTMLVSSLARQQVTVALSGEGGDELFHGYGSYQWSRRLHNPLIRAGRGLIAKMLAASSKQRLNRAAGYFKFDQNTFLPAHIFSQEQNFFDSNEVYQLTGKMPDFASIKNRLDFDHMARKLNARERQAYFDIQYYLPGDLLTKVDRASMAYSLETRVPYLDHRIVETVLNIHPRLKYKNGTSKYILKQILYQYIPPQYFDRPKQGFAIPLEKWLQHELKDFILDHLSEECMKKAGFVQDIAMVENLKNRFFGGETYLYSRLWSLALLHRWHRKL